MFSEAGVYEFRWADGSEVKFENWASSPGQVADAPCVEMKEDGSWINQECRSVYGYVCMKTKKTRECPSNMVWVRRSVGSFMMAVISAVFGPI